MTTNCRKQVVHACAATHPARCNDHVKFNDEDGWHKSKELRVNDWSLFITAGGVSDPRPDIGLEDPRVGDHGGEGPG